MYSHNIVTINGHSRLFKCIFAMLNQYIQFCRLNPIHCSGLYFHSKDVLNI